MYKDRLIKKIIRFLIINGWKQENDLSPSEYYVFINKNNYHIDINKDDGEIVLIADIGDVFHIQLNYNSVYTLIGFLVMHPCDNLIMQYKLK